MNQDLMLFAASFTEPFEARIPHFYLDGEQNVTIGVGHLVASVDYAMSLPLAPNDANQIRADFLAVSGAPAGYLAQWYSKLCVTRMEDVSMTGLFHADLVRIGTELFAKLPDIENWPAPAQVAALDMAFNLGVGGFMKFQHLIAAAAARNWATAADESRRVGIQAGRNTETKNLFLSCAEPA